MVTTTAARHRLLAGLLAFALALSAARASAQIDVTGRWRVTWSEPSFGFTYERLLTLTQAGGTLTVGQPSNYAGGTIDPGTGAFHLDGQGSCFNIFNGQTTFNPWSIDAVAAMDGQTFGGTFAESVQPTMACFLINGTLVGERMLESCGNAVVDAGEACDEGPAGGVCCTEFCTPWPAGTTCPSDGGACTANAKCDGAGACVQNPKPAGTLCRFATDACDTPEVCTGSSSTCPAEAGPTEPDEDDDGIIDGCDDCVGVGPLEAVRIKFGRVGVGQVRDFLTLRARVRFPAGQTLPDPRVSRKLVEGRDANGAPLFYAQVPGGDYDPALGHGWTLKGKKWTFKSVEPVIGAVSKMVIYPAKGDADAWEVRVSTPRGNLNNAVPVPPLSLQLILDGLGPSNRCGQLVFNPPGGASPSCSAPNGGGVITCK